MLNVCNLKWRNTEIIMWDSRAFFLFSCVFLLAFVVCLLYFVVSLPYFVVCLLYLFSYCILRPALIRATCVIIFLQKKERGKKKRKKKKKKKKRRRRLQRFSPFQLYFENRTLSPLSVLPSDNQSPVDWALAGTALCYEIHMDEFCKTSNKSFECNVSCLNVF